MKADDFDAEKSFPHSVRTLQWRETHISWILLTGDFVYKIKKPVNFGFLDFSSLEKRKHYCEEELRLNSRTAPQWYLSVEPLYRDACGLNFCGRGDLVDFAVKMVQFDPDALLPEELKAAAVDIDFFRQLGEDLAQFHQQVAIDEHGNHAGGLDAIWYPVAENFRQISPLLANAQQRERLVQHEHWAKQAFSELRPLFEQRMKKGAIRECHGDLHMGNIAVVDGRALLFDCIEFNERFRWIDCASDLAFLIMDMQFQGYSTQANALLNQYLVISDDYLLLPVLRFYMAYRAMVRAKVNILRLQQEDLEPKEKADAEQQFERYLLFAQHQSEPAKAPLILTCGVSGTGKSTFARRLAGNLAAIHLRSDVVRKQLAGLKPLQSSTGSEDSASLNQGIYTRAFSEKTFDRLASIVEICLSNGFPVIVDATFLVASHRQRFIVIGEQYAEQIVIVHFQVAYDILVNRIETRQKKGDDPSEATVAVLQEQLRKQQDFTEQELPLVVAGCNSVGDFDFDPIMSRLKAKATSEKAGLD